MSTNVSQIVENYPIQATIAPASATPPGFYFLPQPTSDRIVPSTRKQWSSGKGYGIVNESSSQAPVAIRFYGKTSSAPVILRPGESVYPGEFDSFEYGLPFGWAGGGIVMLKVAQAKEARFDLTTARPELIYWRTALKVEAEASPLPTLKRNWPSSFPWEFGLGQGGANQNGQPILRVEPVRTFLFLPNAGVAAGLAAGGAYNARLYFRSVIGDLAVDPNLASFFADVSWVVPAGGLIFPGVIAELPATFDRLDLNNGGVTITSPDGSLAVADYCYAVRYGRI